MAKMKFSIRFSRIVTNDKERNNFISVTIEDKSNGVRVFDGELSPEQFTLCLTGMEGVGTSEVFCNLIGKVRETKTVSVPTDAGYRSFSKDEKEIILSPYEVDGWKAYYDDFGNHHKFDPKKSCYAVTFSRFVDSGVSENER